MEDIPRSQLQAKGVLVENSISDCADAHSEYSRCSAIYFLAQREVKVKVRE